ncbi:MAG TPA: hypothetical protein VMU41_08705 [Candidatus Binataceae bacterium]|nr:hypothetical protein [Candidatus Binataceae bacterium]
MASDNGSRRFVRLWWALAFTAGASAGATSIILIGLQDTVWWIIGVCGSVIVVTAIFERYGDGALGSQQSPKRRWRPPNQGSAHAIGRRDTKPKSPTRRGRLRAINGKKTIEPPSIDES